MAKLLDALRTALIARTESRNQIARDSGVNASQLSRLVNGERGLSVEAVEKLAEYLGLQITITPKGKKEKGR